MKAWSNMADLFEIDPKPGSGRPARPYHHLDRYLDDLAGDVYAQPPDPGHQALIEDVISHWLPGLADLHSILDAGCGQGQAIALLRGVTPEVMGVTLGSDVAECLRQGFQVYEADMTFLPFEDESFSLVFSRHSLEHSPMPLITLMEWRRVSSRYLLLVVPSIWSFGWYGRNHYSVLFPGQWRWLLKRAGWEVIRAEDSAKEEEHRFLCVKAEPVKE